MCWPCIAIWALYWVFAGMVLRELWRAHTAPAPVAPESVTRPVAL